MKALLCTHASTPDDLIEFCMKEGIGVIKDDAYDPFYGRSEREQLDWILFGWFIGNGSESAFDHVEWILQRPFQNVEEWLGPEGDKFRANPFSAMPPVSDKCRKAWKKWHSERCHMTEKEIKVEIERIRAEHYAKHGWK